MILSNLRDNRCFIAELVRKCIFVREKENSHA
jgi:hypothetical protein